MCTLSIFPTDIESPKIITSDEMFCMVGCFWCLMNYLRGIDLTLGDFTRDCVHQGHIPREERLCNLQYGVTQDMHTNVTATYSIH